MKNTSDLLALFAKKIKNYNNQLSSFYNDLDVLLYALSKNTYIYNKAANNISVAEIKIAKTEKVDTLAAEAAKEAEDFQEQITQITAQITLEQDDTEKCKLEVQKSSLESQYNSVKNTADLLAVLAIEIKSYDKELGLFYNDLDVLFTALGENANVCNKAVDNINVAKTISTEFDDINSLKNLIPTTHAIINSWSTLNGLTTEITDFALEKNAK